MSDFNIAMQRLLTWEGKTFTNDPKDHGGATKFGLTLSFLQGEVDKNYTEEQVKDMTEEQACEIYQKYWWDKYHLSSINDQTMANKVYDTIVNLGPNHAIRIVQKAINDVVKPIHIDGVLGDQTLAQLNGPKQADILVHIRLNLVSFYNSIVAANPSQGRFIKGWLNRANG